MIAKQYFICNNFVGNNGGKGLERTHPISLYTEEMKRLVKEYNPLPVPPKIAIELQKTLFGKPLVDIEKAEYTDTVALFSVEKENCKQETVGV